MGQIVVPGSPPSIILTSVDRLVAANADGGVSPLASHIILLGEDAGMNLGDVDNIIAIGAFTFDAGLADSNLDGSIALGVNAGTALIGASVGAGADAAVILIGKNAGAAATTASDSVVIGTGAASIAIFAIPGDLPRDVIIGTQAMESINDSLARDSVVIGYRAARTATGGGAFQTNVVIGSQALLGSYGVTVQGNVIIGERAGPQVPLTANMGTNVAIGQQAGQSLDGGSRNVLVGFNANVNSAATLNFDNVGIGTNAGVSGAGSTVIGSGARNSPSGAATDGSIIIGAGAGGDFIAAQPNHTFYLGTVVAGTTRVLMYGNMETGNLIIGKNTEAAPAVRDLPGTNVLKLMNGTATGNPVGGGMFYVTAGELAWRSSTGADYFAQTSSRGVYTVATLPAASLAAGQRAYVSNALAPAFGAAVAGGGAVFTPVFYNGAAWIVG